MTSTRSDFKPSQVFGWDNEPIDERPSEFVQSTGYSALSGYHAMPEPNGLAERRRQRQRGTTTLLLICALVLAAGTAAMFGLVHLLDA